MGWMFAMAERMRSASKGLAGIELAGIELAAPCRPLFLDKSNLLSRQTLSTAISESTKGGCL